MRLQIILRRPADSSTIVVQVPCLSVSGCHKPHPRAPAQRRTTGASRLPPAFDDLLRLLQAGAGCLEGSASLIRLVEQLQRQHAAVPDLAQRPEDHVVWGSAVTGVDTLLVRELRDIRRVGIIVDVNKPELGPVEFAHKLKPAAALGHVEHVRQ